MTAFVPTPPVPNPIVYPYPLAASCPGTQNSCSSGLIMSNASAGTVYYKVKTIETSPQYFNGRIIINR